MKSWLRRGNVSSRKNRWTPRITQTWRRSGGSFLDRLLGQEGVESAEELQQRVLTAKEQLASTSAILKALRLRLRRRRQSFYEEELRLAWKRRDLAATFRWSRLLGGRRWGAKKRDYRAMSAAPPLKKAWKDECTKPGAEGGMGAVELESWSEWRIQSRDLVRRSELNARVSEDARRDLEELKSSYRTVKKRRACPAGTPPAELWTMLLHASRNLSPAGPRERESCMCCLQLESNFSKSCFGREGTGGCHPHPLIGCTVTFQGGGGNRQSL